MMAWEMPDNSMTLSTGLLHRFEEPRWLFDSLSTGKLAFSHPKLWKDKYEYEFLTACKVVVKNALNQGPDGLFRGSIPPRLGVASANMGSTNAFGTFVFGQCFTSVPDTQRLWESNRGRIRWTVDASEYITAIQNAAGQHTVTLEEVRYLPTDAVNEVHQKFVDKYGCATKLDAFEQWSFDVKEPLTTKRHSGFSDEHEYRLILIYTTLMHLPRNPGTPPPLALYQPKPRFVLSKLPMQDLIHERCLQPEATEAEVASVTIQLRALGYRGAVKKSNLYDGPVLSTFIERPIET
jgi:hypothetical protein